MEGEGAGGVAEAIIDADLPIVDAQHHLFVRPAVRYLADELKADLASGHRIVATVYVEAGGFARPDGPERLRPIGEVEFANGVGAMARAGYFDGTLVCDGIVANADLRWGDDLPPLLDRMLATAPERLCGIRQIAINHENPAAFATPLARPPAGLLGDGAFRAGFAHLAARGLPFDVAIYHGQFDELTALADAFPDATLVLNHMGMVFARGEDAATRERLRQEWRAGLREVAARPNIVCKVGGLGIPAWGFDYGGQPGGSESAALARLWTPYVETAIELFGPDRCMFESNFPIDRGAGSFAALWNAFKRITRGCSPAERERMFMGTAVDTYRLKLGPD